MTTTTLGALTHLSLARDAYVTQAAWLVARLKLKGVHSDAHVCLLICMQSKLSLSAVYTYMRRCLPGLALLPAPLQDPARACCPQRRRRPAAQPRCCFAERSQVGPLGPSSLNDRGYLHTPFRLSMMHCSEHLQLDWPLRH